MFKDYMESGSFSRDTEELTSQASMVYVGNIDLDVEDVLKSSHLFKPFLVHVLVESPPQGWSE